MDRENQELVESILKATDIVTVVSSYLPLTKKGREYLAVCPFHADTRPSLHISPEKQIFKCFVDGEGGNAIQFVMKYEKIPFWDAVRKVAAISGISDPRLEQRTARKKDAVRDPLYACMADLVAFYRYSLLTEEGKAALEYLRSRGIDKATQDRFLIGYAPKDGQKTIQYLLAKGHTPKTIEGIGIAALSENMRDANAGRVVFPLGDLEGRTVGLSARRLGDGEGPKYVNSPETAIFQKNRILYNAHLAKDEARRAGYVYVTEGFMDVIALFAAGEPAVAIMGTALTPSQIRAIKEFKAEIRLCLDGDAPGQEAMMRSIAPLNKSGLPFRLVRLNDERDPDEILRQDGKDTLLEKLKNLEDPLQFQLSYYVGTKKPETEADRKKVLEHFLPYLGSLKEGIDLEQAIARLSQATGYERSAILALLQERKPEESYEAEGILYESGRSPGYSKPPESRIARAEREILYYMLNYGAAVDFYEKNVDYFVTPIYAEIAAYIVDFAREHEGMIDPSLLLLEMSEQGEDGEITKAVSGLVAEGNHPAYDGRILEECLSALKEERAEKAAEEKAINSLRGKTNAEKAKVLEEFARKRKELLKSKYASKEEDQEGR